MLFLVFQSLSCALPSTLGHLSTIQKGWQCSLLILNVVPGTSGTIISRELVQHIPLRVHSTFHLLLYFACDNKNNKQSIRKKSRFADSCTERVLRDHDLVLISDTWRYAVEECFVLPNGGLIFFSAPRRRKERTCPEFIGSRRCRLVVPGSRTEGRWRRSFHVFQTSGPNQERTSTTLLQTSLAAGAAAALLSQWPVLLGHAPTHAFAAACSLTVTPPIPTWRETYLSQVLAEAPFHATNPSRLPGPSPLVTSRSSLETDQ